MCRQVSALSNGEKRSMAGGNDMRKRVTALLLTVFLLTAALLPACGAESGGISWTKEERAKLRVANPTPLQGKFFTTMWGGTTSDLDVQDLLHGYSPVRYDIELSKYRFDHSVVQDAAILDDEEGNRTYLLVFYNDLYWSNGMPITAADYAFSILFCMDPVIKETGGKPMDYSWICGAEEYLSHKSKTLSGVRLVTDRILQVKVRAETLPYFYELSRLMIHPYPAVAIAPGISVQDDGEGVYLTEPLTAELIRDTVLDEETGYLSHPTVVSGPYKLTEYAEGTAKFTINSYYKGTEQGILPRIGELEYTSVKNENMIGQLLDGEFGLLNKVTFSRNIQEGILSRASENYDISAENYARSGLTMLWFMETSPLVQEPEVRKAVAACFDREGFVQEYTGAYGLTVDGMYGLGQWMYRLATGQMGPPVDENLPEEEIAAAAEAFEELSLDGLTTYSLDIQAAEQMLENAGWKRNAEGIRCRENGGMTTELRLTLGMPESAETREALEKYLVRNLKEAGIDVVVRTMTMAEIGAAYEGKAESADMIYLGEDFMILVDTGILKPVTGAGTGDVEGSLPAVKTELYGMAQEMVRTEPEDLLGFMQKWIALQERITETLPLLPVYSNVYFDFFTRELHNYRITAAPTWGETIVDSYMSDTEEPGKKDKMSLQEQLEELEKHFGEKKPSKKLK